MFPPVPSGVTAASEGSSSKLVKFEFEMLTMRFGELPADRSRRRCRCRFQSGRSRFRRRPRRSAPPRAHGVDPGPARGRRSSGHVAEDHRIFQLSLRRRRRSPPRAMTSSSISPSSRVYQQTLSRRLVPFFQLAGAQRRVRGRRRRSVPRDPQASSSPPRPSIRRSCSVGFASGLTWMSAVGRFSSTAGSPGSAAEVDFLFDQ